MHTSIKALVLFVSLTSLVAGQTIELYTDTACADLHSTWDCSDKMSCSELTAGINSYMITTESDGCDSSSPTSEFDSWVLTTSDVCGSDDQVGGGCGDMTGCQTTQQEDGTATTATYFVCELQSEFKF